jgi:hypothetical protein
MLNCCYARPKELIYSYPYGTCVKAISHTDARMKILSVMGKKNEYWATETEDNVWSVQLSEYVTIDEILAPDSREAVRLADLHLATALVTPSSTVRFYKQERSL